jgi:hypothetical protein
VRVRACACVLARACLRVRACACVLARACELGCARARMCKRVLCVFDRPRPPGLVRHHPVPRARPPAAAAAAAAAGGVGGADGVRRRARVRRARPQRARGAAVELQVRRVGPARCKRSGDARRRGRASGARRLTLLLCSRLPRAPFRRGGARAVAELRVRAMPRTRVCTRVRACAAHACALCAHAPAHTYSRARARAHACMHANARAHARTRTRGPRGPRQVPEGRGGDGDGLRLRAPLAARVLHAGALDARGAPHGPPLRSPPPGHTRVRVRAHARS